MTGKDKRDAFLWGAFMLALLLFGLLLPGCAGTLEQPIAPVNDIVYCRRLDRVHATWGAIGKGAATLAGSGGLAVLPIDQDEKGLRITVAASAVAFAALSVGALYAADGYAESFVRDCTPKPPGPAEAGK